MLEFGSETLSFPRLSYHAGQDPDGPEDSLDAAMVEDMHLNPISDETRRDICLEVGEPEYKIRL